MEKEALPKGWIDGFYGLSRQVGFLKLTVYWDFFTPKGEEKGYRFTVGNLGGVYNFSSYREAMKKAEDVARQELKKALALLEDKNDER